MAAERNLGKYSSNKANSSAYRNYNYYSRPAEKPVEDYRSEPNPEMIMKITAPRKVTVIGLIKMFLIAGVAVSVLILFLKSSSETVKIDRQISSANEMYEEVRSENIRLQSELESKLTLKNIEDYAVNVLGLQKLDNSQLDEVSTKTDDVVVLSKREKNIFIRIKDKFKGIVDYIVG